MIRHFALTFLVAALSVTAFTVKAAPGLSSYDKKVIGIYIADGYQSLNGALREAIAVPGLDQPFVAGYGPMNELDHKLYFQLKHALYKLPPYVTTGKNPVWRGIYTMNLDKPEMRFVKGTVFRDSSFTSATKSRDVAKTFMMGKDKIMDPEFNPPLPKNMILIKINSLTARDLSTLNKEEAEVLLLAGTIFRVDEAARDSKGRYAVTLTELDPAKMSVSEQAALEKSDRARRESKFKDHYAKEDGSIDEKAVKDSIEQAKRDYRTRAESGSLTKEDLSVELFMNEGGD